MALRRGLGRFSGAGAHCMTTKTGRPQAIPKRAYAEVHRLHGLGHGYQRISPMLESLGVFTSKSSVERCVKGLGCYSSYS